MVGEWTQMTYDILSQPQDFIESHHIIAILDLDITV